MLPCDPYLVEGAVLRPNFSREIAHIASALFMFTPQGIGVLGTGATLQIADAQRGRGGVGISNSFPWVAAAPPRMQLPE